MSFEGLKLGRYHLLRILGSGGMGEVYLAEDTRIQRQVAIKVVRNEPSSYPNDDTVRRAAELFEREMKTISRLDHPHILPLYDYGEEEVNGQTLLYMVMPYRPEGSLANWLRRRTTSSLLAPRDVAYFIAQAAAALQYAHNNQIIHQDVKPSNFLIRNVSERPRQPDLLLTDFGIARFTTATSNSSQTIRGTPTYMAPEQWEGHPTYATDQYALAIMTYELLVGHPPFEGNPGQMMYKHLMGQPEAPSSLRPELPKDADSVILHALAKQPGERFASITAFANALQQALHAEDLPPILNAAERPQNNDIQAALTIGAAEAQAGTSRVLNIGGQQVTVTIPPHAYAGQVIRVDNWNQSPGGGALLLTLTVAEAVNRPASSSAAQPPLNTRATTVGDENSRFTVVSGSNLPGVNDASPMSNPQQPLILPTMVTPPATNEQQLAQPATPVLSGNSNPGVPPYYDHMAPGTRPQSEAAWPSAGMAGPGGTAQYTQAIPAPRKSSAGKIFLIVLLVLILIGGSGGLFYYFSFIAPSNGFANATATAQANNNATTQAQGNNDATSTALAQGSNDTTATAQAQGNNNATATAQAQGNNDATATAQANQANANATATAQANVNATATVQASTPLNIAITPTTVHANSTACTYTPAVDTSGNPGWSCQIVLSNQGFSDLNWTYAVATASTGTGGGGPAIRTVPLSGGGIYVTPAHGTIHGQQTQTATIIVEDPGGNNIACTEGSFNFTFMGPANTITVNWICP